MYKTDFLLGNNDQKLNYKKYSNCLMRIKMTSKKMHFAEKFENGKHDQVKIWQTIREILYIAKTDKTR